MKRLISITLVFLLLVTTLTACNKGGTVPSTSQQPSASAPAASESKPQESSSDIDDTKGTLTFWHGATDDLRQAAYDKAVERFNKKYPNIKVEQTKLDSDAYKTKIKTVMGAGATDIPDVFMSWGGDVLKTYVNYGLVRELTDLFAQYMDEYYDFEFGISTFDGKVYGAGVGIAPAAVFYNKDIFKKVSIRKD